MKKQLNRGVIVEVCSFAFDRYSGGIEGDTWRKRMYFLSPLTIAKLYLKEFIEWKDMQRWCRKFFPGVSVEEAARKLQGMAKLFGAGKLRLDNRR